MKAIFPCSYYLPETAASLYITDNIVHACAENGVEVELYTPTPTRSVPDGAEWKRIRDQVILRDNACDLGMVDREINSRIIIHHMNPLTKYDVINQTEFLLNPDYMICVTKRTHDAIHYGDEAILFGEFIERSKNDTCPWRR